MAIRLLDQHLRAVPDPPALRPVEEVPLPPAGVADVSRLLHLDARHCVRAMSLWSQVIGIPVPTLMRCVVDRGDTDPGPPRWVVERTRK